jgi:hypothetical protein
MDKIGNRRLKIWSVVCFNRPMYNVIKGLAILLLLKYSIRYVSLIFATIPGIDGGRGEVIGSIIAREQIPTCYNWWQAKVICITVPTTKYNIENTSCTLILFPICKYVDIDLPLSHLSRTLRVQLPLSPIYMFMNSAIVVVFSY